MADGDDGGAAGGIEQAASISGEEVTRFAANRDGIISSEISGKK
jgi:hypothetical protein